ncbi:MAG: hypothetical protein SPI12_07125 [Actinomycetaceae bacterium]|nr:hypothetical protein [Actinomycetaceae bacterium]MDY6083607.1 hypothetical protein [Actinomycetaceae bacterium]
MDDDRATQGVPATDVPTAGAPTVDVHEPTSAARAHAARAIGVLRFVGFLLLGFATGVMAVAVHSGPVAIPIVGAVLALAVLFCGAWYSALSGWGMWCVFFIGALSALVLLFFHPLANDYIVGLNPSAAWVVLIAGSALMAAVGVACASTAIRQRRVRKHRKHQPSQD